VTYKGKELKEYIGNSSHHFVDLSGQTLGMWYIICRGENSKVGHSRFWVECLLCHEVTLKLATHFRSKKTNSCSKCANTKILRQQFRTALGTTYKIKIPDDYYTNNHDIPYWFWNSIDRKHRKSTRGARRTLPFTITPEYVWALFLDQNKCCALSGVPLTFCKHDNRIKRKDFQTASLDRIDSSKGYVEGNVQWVHKDVNRMKNIFNQEYFIDMCKKNSRKELICSG
jgi:hypothetical protein